MIGCYGPHQIILPIFFNGDINMRPIPYIRLKNSGDLVLDLSLSHEAVFEKNMTITCEYSELNMDMNMDCDII